MILMSFMFLLFATAVNPAQGQEIKEITKDGVFLTCGGGEGVSVKWFKDDAEIKENTNQTYKAEADQGTGIVEGIFKCEYKRGDTDVKDMFYLRVKVCENCYELNGLMAWGVITGDLLITGGVILIVYIFATKNTDGTQKRASNARSLNPPRPPNPDYEALDPKMRGNAVYAGLNK